MSSDEGDDQSSNFKPKKRRKRVNGFEEWGGYMAAKKMKLEAQFKGQQPIELQEDYKSSIFSGISIFVNGYTNPPAEELKRLMRLHGGTYHHYYSLSKTSHIIASNLPHTKIKKLKNEIVVTAQWITDSIKAGKLLPTYKYLLYTPENKDKQQKLCFNKSPNQIDEQCSKSNLFVEHTVEKESSFKASTNDYSDPEIVSSPPCFDNSDSEEPIQTKDEKADTKPVDTSKNSANDPPCLVTNPSTSAHAINTGFPEFLSEFYNHSRLHHISTGKQELKSYVQHLIENQKSFPGREKLRKYAYRQNIFDEDLFQDQEKSKKLSPIIMHLDMDCFFVSVGLRNHPELKGLPVAVTHSKGKRGGPQKGSDVQYEASYYANKHEKLKGLSNPDDEDLSQFKPTISKYSKDYGSLSEIASCSYEARKAGLRNGMFLGEALRRCPNLKTTPYDFESYSEVSKKLYDIVASYTLDIEAVSVDELYIDCTELLIDTKALPNQFASILREDIYNETKCSASAGLGSNMLLARLATKMGKPNGQYYVLDSEIEEFMKKQKTDDLPGVGYRTSKKLEQLGIFTCADLQNLTLTKLQKELGSKTGESVYKKCRGQDNRAVQVQKDRKSVSAEINYGIRFETNEDVNRFINELAVEVQNRLQNINCKGKSITLKLMVRRPDAPVQTAKFMGHGVCDNMSKSIVLKSATDNSKLIGSECCTLARALKINPQDYRGVGIQVSKLESILKEESSHKTLKNFFNQNNSSTKTTKPSISKSPKRPEPLLTPVKHTIKHFLSKPVKKISYDLADYVPDQLDQSVLNALPEDIKREVLQNCGKHTSPVAVRSCLTDSSTKSSPDSKLIQKEHNYPNKVSSFSNSLSELDNTKASTSAGPSVKEFTSKKEMVKKPTLIQTVENVNGSKSSSSPKRRRIEFFITWGERENKTLKEPTKEVSLGGAVELDDVRKILKEWILNTQTPLEEDIEELKQFLLDCIDQNLSKVSLLLKYFHRLVSSQGSSWKEAYLTVLSCVQQKTLQSFGAMLSANCDFPT